MRFAAYGQFVLVHVGATAYNLPSFSILNSILHFEIVTMLFTIVTFLRQYEMLYYRQESRVIAASLWFYEYHHGGTNMSGVFYFAKE